MAGNGTQPPGPARQVVNMQIKLEQEVINRLGMLSTQSGVDPNVILNGWIKVGMAAAAILPVVGFLADVQQSATQRIAPAPMEKGPDPNDVDDSTPAERLAAYRAAAAPSPESKAEPEQPARKDPVEKSEAPS